MTTTILRQALLGFALLCLLQAFGLVSASGESLASLVERSRNRDVQYLARRGPRVNNRKWSASLEDVGGGFCRDGTYSIRFEGNTLRIHFRSGPDFAIVEEDMKVASCGFIAGALLREGEPTPKWHHDPGGLHDGTPKRRNVGPDSEPVVTIQLIPDPFTENELQDIADFHSGNVTTGGYLVRRQNGLVDKVALQRFTIAIVMWYAQPGETWRITDFNLDFPA